MKMMKNMVKTEEVLEKLGGSGFESRDRRKSKYLSPPYTNSRSKQKDLPNKTKDLRTPGPSLKGKASSVATKPLNGSSSYAKMGSKRFRKNWHRKIFSSITMSSSSEFRKTSANKLLSGLYSTAIDCMFPVGNKSFDLVERFFCRYRVSNYHDEAEHAPSLVNAKDEKVGKPVGNDLLDSKSKKRKNNKTENAVRCKRKSLSGLSEVNANTSCGDSLRLGTKLKQKKKLEEVVSVHQQQNVEINLNGGSSKCSSVPEDSPNLSCLAFGGKNGNKKRGEKEAQADQSAQITSVHTDAKGCNGNSLVIDLQFTSPSIPVDISERNKCENKEQLVSTASNPESCVSQGPVGSITDYSLLVSTRAEVGTVRVNKTGLKNSMSKTAGVPLKSELVEKTGLKNNMGNLPEKPLDTQFSVGKTGLKNSTEKAAEKLINAKLAVDIPDLNGTGTECNSISPQFDTINFFSPEMKSVQSRNLFACSRPTKSTTCNGVEDNGEALGTCLLLQFAPGANIPLKEDLMTTFYRFGPLKASETQLLKDTSSAQVVFVRNTDAAAAFHCLEQNRFAFGDSTLVDCKLNHLSAACPSVELETPTQPTGYMAMPGVTPIQPPAAIAVPCVTPNQPAGSIIIPGVTPTQPTGSMAMPGVTPTQQAGSMAMPGETPPSLQFIKQRLQMMTTILENSGNSLSPQMRAKLDAEIKGLMIKVNSRTKT